VKRAALAEDWRPGGLESRRRRRWDCLGGMVDGGGLPQGLMVVNSYEMDYPLVN